jgi:hypothetical protein
MTMPIKTFSGVSGKGLGGTNGAGTVSGGGIQRDLTTLFAMFNPEATRPDGVAGGINKDNMATDIWDGFIDDHIATEDSLGVVRVPAKFITANTGKLKYGGFPQMFADTGWLAYPGFTYTWTFGTPLTTLEPPYFVHIWFANDVNGTGMWQFNGSAVSANYVSLCDNVTEMTKTGCVLTLVDSYTYTSGSSSGSTSITYITSHGAYFRAMAFRIVVDD